jgi:hypothetical protein
MLSFKKFNNQQMEIFMKLSIALKILGALLLSSATSWAMVDCHGIGSDYQSTSLTFNGAYESMPLQHIIQIRTQDQNLTMVAIQELNVGYQGKVEMEFVDDNNEFHVQVKHNRIVAASLKLANTNKQIPLQCKWTTHGLTSADLPKIEVPRKNAYQFFKTKLDALSADSSVGTYEFAELIGNFREPVPGYSQLIVAMTYKLANAIDLNPVHRGVYHLPDNEKAKVLIQLSRIPENTSISRMILYYLGKKIFNTTTQRSLLLAALKQSPVFIFSAIEIDLDQQLLTIEESLQLLLGSNPSQPTHDDISNIRVLNGVKEQPNFCPRAIALLEEVKKLKMTFSSDSDQQEFQSELSYAQETVSTHCK